MPVGWLAFSKQKDHCEEIAAIKVKDGASVKVPSRRSCKSPSWLNNSSRGIRCYNGRNVHVEATDPLGNYEKVSFELYEIFRVSYKNC